MSHLGGDKVCHVLVAAKLVTFWWRQSLSHFGGDKMYHIFDGDNVCHISAATKVVTFRWRKKLVATKLVTFLAAAKLDTFWWRQRLSHFGCRQNLSHLGGDKVCHFFIPVMCIRSSMMTAAALIGYITRNPCKKTSVWPVQKIT